MSCYFIFDNDRMSVLSDRFLNFAFMDMLVMLVLSLPLNYNRTGGAEEEAGVGGLKKTYFKNVILLIFTIYVENCIYTVQRFRFKILQYEPKE